MQRKKTIPFTTLTTAIKNGIKRHNNGIHVMIEYKVIH